MGPLADGHVVMNRDHVLVCNSILPVFNGRHVYSRIMSDIIRILAIGQLV
jgi:hypothetical protein